MVNSWLYEWLIQWIIQSTIHPMDEFHQTWDYLDNQWHERRDIWWNSDKPKSVSQVLAYPETQKYL